MMQYAIFARPVVTIYDLPQTTKQSEAGLVSTIGDEGLYGQACQVRTAPGGVTAEGVPLSPEVAEVVTFYGYHGFVRRDALKFVSEDALRAYLPQPLVLVGRATDVLSLPKVQGVRMMELERGGLLRRVAEKRGLIVFTDSDGAGFVIRNHIKSAIPGKYLKHAYIPDIPGKERRKSAPGREGKLGVEGMTPEVILAALRNAGATIEGEKTTSTGSITKQDLMALGLSGGSNAGEKRKALLKKLNLPEHMSANAMLQALNLLYTREELEQMLNESGIERD